MKTFRPWYSSGACCRLSHRIFITSRSFCTLAMMIRGLGLGARCALSIFTGLGKLSCPSSSEMNFETHSVGRSPSSPSLTPTIQMFCPSKSFTFVLRSPLVAASLLQVASNAETRASVEDRAASINGAGPHCALSAGLLNEPQWSPGILPVIS
ncbi:hypothetical protein ILYODFUR_033763 [Ilyodon furcidens]|uniref:Uncharacterized protein n=1 Tax=Ilyodon furcidens TaxID=33524 RepID=A0ABV0U022_9TELE